MTLWSQLSKPWQASLQMAWEAYCCGSVPIGAAVAGPGGQVLSTGRNRLYDPYQVGPLSLAGTRLAHAEINAMLSADFQAVNPRECTLYTTTEPCPMCAGALVMVNVRHVCFASRDPWAGSTDLLAANRYVLGKQIRVDGPPEARLETLLVSIQYEYFLRNRASRGLVAPMINTDPVLCAYQAMFPQAVRLATHLFDCGDLLRLGEDGCPVEDTIERLEHML